LGLPTHAAVLQPHTLLAKSDYLLAFTAIAILALEFTADNQQWAFHAYKHAFIAQKKNDNSKKYDPHQHWFGSRLNWQPQDAERGFCTKGLWALSRHPNCACEQSFWVCNSLKIPFLNLRLNSWTQIIITAFPILSPDSPFVATLSSFSSGGRDLWVHLGCQILPAVSLCLLFWASTNFTESITASKYPAYKAYQKRVAMFSPTSTLLLRILRSLIFGEDGKELDRLIWTSEKVE
jgi:steroid 5-alpha reductase family enzyme